MRRLLLASAALLIASAAAADASQCYRRVVDSPRYASVAERVMVSPAREIEETVPATTREVEETVVVRPERSVTRVIPAQYSYEQRIVEAEPAHREWRTRDESGDVIGCWVNVPARYARLVRRVLVSPEREVVETIPAETATRTHTVVVEPERTVTREVPARYATRERTVLASPGGARWARIDGCD